MEIQYKYHSWHFHPHLETFSFQVNPTKNSYSPSNSLTIFTDGSNTDSVVFSAFCIMENGVAIQQLSERLGMETRFSKFRSMPFIKLSYGLPLTILIIMSNYTLTAFKVSKPFIPLDLLILKLLLSKNNF